MTLLQSDIKTVRQKAGKIALNYAAATMLCMLFSFVYEQFSHGVYSSFMVYLFLFPLIGGVLPFITIFLFGRSTYILSAPLSNLYNYGVITLTVGSCVTGIFEIYGTESAYTIVYWVAGLIMCVLGIISILINRLKLK